MRAKEALSSDTDVSIPVLLPNVSTEIRLTRAELEAMVRPALYDSIEALKRALRSANTTADQLQAVLLVGGSSRMPIVAQLVGAELGRPVAVDAHPKHAVALGAALLASGSPAPAPASPAPSGAATAPVRATASVPVARPGTYPPPVAPPVPAPVAVVGVGDLPPAADPFGSAELFPAVDPMAAGAAPPYSPAGFGAPAPPQPPGPTQPRSRRLQLLIAAGAGVAVLLIAGIAFAVSNLGGGNGGGGGQGQGTTPPGQQQTTAPAVPADQVCTDQIKSNPRWVCLTKATLNNKQLVIEYDSSNTPFDVTGGFHLHIYGTDGTGTNPPDRIMGAQSRPAGNWYVEDKNPSVRSITSGDYKEAIGANAKKVCARIANSRHELVPDASGAGTFVTGNCVPIEVVTG